MNNYFTIKQAAEIVDMTTETLRHYDRIGLVKPCHKDELSGYRYYSEQELVKLQTIELLKAMDLTLMDIKDILQQNDLSKVIAFLKQAEKRADDKIARLQYAKSKIKRAYLHYENKFQDGYSQSENYFVRHIEERVIMLSNKMESPTLKNLWDYHRHFYQQIETSLHSQFLFEDMAGMFTTEGITRLFAVCLKYPSLEGLTVLPEGDYLCAICTEENKNAVLQNLLERAKTEYDVCPDFVLHNIIVTGILQWDYQIQLFIKKEKKNV
ncbi:MerR family transcriptional regulator [Paenibacillus sp. B2(2019)]|uniref:MerR family transcriptional regulator n=1 Tax=Paenibacillus sp. B2(2019) TaxID=2607754 RepID=UPI00165FCE94|nr:MerR family transcriptional regulator [Paenibacillus sp. B2(2019)]